MVVVEDSLVQRVHLVAALEADGDIEVVGQAANAIDAIEQVTRLRPHVVTLDLQIPAGGGQFALEQIMADAPTPVVVLSSTVRSDASAPAMEALVGGALIALPKPLTWTPALEKELRRHVRTMRNVPVIRHIRGKLNRQPAAPSPTRRQPHPVAAPTAERSSTPALSPPTTPASGASRSTGAVVAIAASTGGPPALATVLGGLRGLRSPVLVVQHMHADFVQSLVDWMARVAALPVVMARHGEPLRPGVIHIGPGGSHLRVGAGGRVELVDRPATIHRPSADQLFESIAANVGAQAIGVVLTGMGDDGAVGLSAMHRRGAHTIVQDEETCAVYGMPRAAKRLGAADLQLPLPAIAAAIMRAARRPGVLR